MSNEQANAIIQLINSFKVDNDKQHKDIIEHLEKTNGNVMKNTEFRLRFEGGFGMLKWILAFVGLGNLIIILKLFMKI
jgi:hypothetical protein